MNAKVIGFEVTVYMGTVVRQVSFNDMDETKDFLETMEKMLNPDDIVEIEGVLFHETFCAEPEETLFSIFKCTAKSLTNYLSK